MHSKKETLKKLLYTSCILLASEIALSQTMPVQYENYISKYSTIAVEEMEKYGIPASITLAQGILESGAGTAELAIEANNHFGIKCSDWTGETYFHDDDQAQECFRKYSNAEQSYEDHSKFLTTRERYASLFTLAKTDYEGWANGLKKAGYATDPNYPQRLIDIIEKYELYKYDTEATTKSKVTYVTEKKQENVPPKSSQQSQPSSKVVYKTSKTTTASKPSSTVVYKNTKSTSNNGTQSTTNNAVTTTQTENKSDSANDEKKVYQSQKMIGQVSPYSEHIVKTVNGIKCVTALENDSYERIAEEFALKINEIYNINDAERGTRPQAGEIVYIRAKKSTATRSFHVVEAGETMRDIAQKYGIKLSSLYKLNNMKEGVLPLYGQRLKLK